MEQMVTESFGWEHFATLGGMVISLIAILVALSSRKGKDVPEQSLGCQFDHKNINTILISQGANLTALVEQNSKLVTALSSFAHTAELRHQTIVAKLERIDEHLKA